MSVAGNIADAIVTAITALGWTTGDPPAAVPVTKRKKPSLPQGKDPVAVSVCVGDTVSVEAMTARKDIVTRNVAVVIVAAGGKKLGGDDDFRDQLEAIRVAVNARACFAGVSEFNRIDPTKKLPFDKTALDKDLNYGLISFAVQTIEARN